MGKAIGRLYFLHITAVLAIWAAMYYPGWDKFCSVLYILVLIAEIRLLVSQVKSLLTVALAWSLPWIMAALSSVLALDWWGLGNIGFFILTCWYTPWLPLLVGAKTIIAGYPLYYYLLLALPLVNFLLFFIIYYISSFKNKAVAINKEEAS